MATVTGFTSVRMLAIENNSVVGGAVNGSGHLILTRQGGGTIDAGSVIGPTGSPGVSLAELNAAFPPGMIIDYIDATPPTGWLKMEGQDVANGQTLYPALWAVIPSTMKVAAPAIRMPDTRGRVSVGLNTSDVAFDTMHETGGAKTHALTIAELATHTHVQDAHNHTQNSHNHAQDPHNHTQNLHNHVQDAHYHLISGSAVAIASVNDTHVHNVYEGFGGGQFVLSRNDGGPTAGVQGVSGSGYSLSTAGSTSEPTDNLSRPPHTHVVWGNTDWQLGTNQGTTATNNASTATNQGTTATNIATTATNQNTGSGTAHNNLQPYIVFLKLIRAV